MPASEFTAALEPAPLEPASLEPATPEQCPVCLGDLGEKNVMTTKCGHTFCASCIIKNLHHSSTCPMCRTELDDETTRIDNRAPMPLEEYEQTAHMLMSATNMEQHMARQIFNAIPVSNWDTLPPNVQEGVKTAIHNGILGFINDFHMFIYPEEIDQVDTEDDDIYEDPPPPPPEHLLQRENTVISRPVEIVTRTPSLSDLPIPINTSERQEIDSGAGPGTESASENSENSIDDLIRGLDLEQIINEENKDEDVAPNVAPDVGPNVGPDEIDRITFINRSFNIINWDELDRIPIPNTFSTNLN